MASDKNKADLSPARKNALKKRQVYDKGGVEGSSGQRRVTTDTELTAPGAKHQPQAKASHRSWSLFEMRKNSIAAHWQPNKLWIESGS